MSPPFSQAWQGLPTVYNRPEFSVSHPEICPPGHLTHQYAGNFIDTPSSGPATRFQNSTYGAAFPLNDSFPPVPRPSFPRSSIGAPVDLSRPYCQYAEPNLPGQGLSVVNLDETLELDGCGDSAPYLENLRQPRRDYFERGHCPYRDLSSSSSSLDLPVSDPLEKTLTDTRLLRADMIVPVFGVFRGDPEDVSTWEYIGGILTCVGACQATGSQLLREYRDRQEAHTGPDRSDYPSRGSQTEDSTTSTDEDFHEPMGEQWP